MLVVVYRRHTGVNFYIYSHVSTAARTRTHVLSLVRSYARTHIRNACAPYDDGDDGDDDAFAGAPLSCTYGGDPEHTRMKDRERKREAR